MAENIVDEIKATEAKSASVVQDAKLEAVRKINEATSSAETQVKEARQKAARDFRAKVAAVEKEAEAKATEMVSAGEAAAKSFFDSHKGKIPGAATAIAEEVMARYVRS